MSYYTAALTNPVAVGEVAPTANESNSMTDVWTVAATASMAVSAYHGYKRNDSLGWALWWGLMGSLFPVVTPVIAVAQGYGEPAKK